MANALAGQTLTASLNRTCRQQVRSARVAFPAFARPSLHVRGVQRLITKSAEQEEADLSGEWPVNWSLASYEDVGEFFKNSLFKEDAGNLLKDVMATSVKSVTPDTTLDSIGSLFDSISGVPVTKSQSDKTLVGVMSKKDLKKASAYDCLLASLLCLQATVSPLLVQRVDRIVLCCRVARQLATSCPHLQLQHDLTTRWPMQLS